MRESRTIDEVIASVREIKESLARKFDFDVHRILEDARSRQKSARREVLPPPRGPRPPAAPSP